ncbi:MAG: adenosylcobinamide-GDP ribazoletransferase [Deltaproteobacteria bacterium]
MEHEPSGVPPPPSSAAQLSFAARGVRAAFVSFTRLPLGGYPYRADDWRWAPAHLPLVGATIGAAAAGLWWLCGVAGLGPSIAATLALGTSVLMSGALHEDGLADAADGLGGGHDRARALSIMKDSQIGTYGALALGFSLLVRVAAISSLQAGDWFWLIAVHCLARVGPVRLMLTEPYVSAPESAKSPHFLPIGPAQLLVALGWAALVLALGMLTGWLPLFGTACVPVALILLTLLAGRYFRNAVGGITGDLLGAVEQVSEIAAWLVLLACRHV